MLKAIDARDGAELIRWGAADWDVAALFSPDEFVFLERDHRAVRNAAPVSSMGLIYLEGEPLA